MRAPAATSLNVRYPITRRFPRQKRRRRRNSGEDAENQSIGSRCGKAFSGRIGRRQNRKWQKTAGGDGRLRRAVSFVRPGGLAEEQEKQSKKKMELGLRAAAARRG